MHGSMEGGGDNEGPRKVDGRDGVDRKERREVRKEKRGKKETG